MDKLINNPTRFVSLCFKRFNFSLFVIFADFYVFHIFGNEYVRLSFEGKGIAFVRMKSITEVYD